MNQSSSLYSVLQKAFYLAFLIWPFFEAENLAFLKSVFHIQAKCSFYGTHPEERLHHLYNYKLSRTGKIFVILSYEFHHPWKLKIHGDNLFVLELILRTGRESGAKLLKR